MSLSCPRIVLIYLFLLSLSLLHLMPAPNAKSIAALHREARKCGNIWVNPVEAASLAVDPSFNSHIDHFDSRDDEFTSGNKMNDDIAVAQQSVFDALPLMAVHVLQPAVQPLNVFLQLSVPTFMVTNDEGVRSNIETDRDLLPDWEFQEVRDYFVKLTAELIMKCDNWNSRQNDNEPITQILSQISQLVPASQPNGA